MEQEISLGANVSVEQVSSEVATIWRQVMTEGSGARKAAMAAGVPVGDLPEISAEQAITVRRAREGADPLLTGILIGAAGGALGNLASDAVRACIGKFLIPYLKQKFGAQDKPGA
jgi:hypothetical protein